MPDLYKPKIHHRADKKAAPTSLSDGGPSIGRKIKAPTKGSAKLKNRLVGGLLSNSSFILVIIFTCIVILTAAILAKQALCPDLANANKQDLPAFCG